MSDNRIIFHIDVNSAYLSWEAVYRLQHGESLDLRDVPSVVGGDPVTRHGIVLAKSIPSKKYKIQTGETVFQAQLKCPELIVVPPRYDHYIHASNAMMELLQEYSPKVQRFSIDEMFLDYTYMDEHFGDPVTAACSIKDRIHQELGFTVNIGISTNKLLAKMASEFEKPDKVHTLFPEEIPDKMWPLPVGELFMVGRATLPKLQKRGIFTIGDLAQTDLSLLKHWLKSHGLLLWGFAHGYENSKVTNDNFPMKGVGNSTTTPWDLDDLRSIQMYLLSLTEMVALRLRDAGKCARVLSLSLRDKDFTSYSHQRKLDIATNSTTVLFTYGCRLLEEMWRGEPIRHIGLRASELQGDDFYQSSLFQPPVEKYRAIDEAVDKIRSKYGSVAIMRSSQLYTGLYPVMGGVLGDEDDYPMMSSIL